MIKCMTLLDPRVWPHEHRNKLSVKSKQDQCKPVSEHSEENTDGEYHANSINKYVIEARIYTLLKSR